MKTKKDDFAYPTAPNQNYEETLLSGGIGTLKLMVSRLKFQITSGPCTQGL